MAKILVGIAFVLVVFAVLVAVAMLVIRQLERVKAQRMTEPGPDADNATWALWYKALGDSTKDPVERDKYYSMSRAYEGLIDKNG